MTYAEELKVGDHVRFRQFVLNGWPPKEIRQVGLVRAIHGSQVTVSYEERRGEEKLRAFHINELES